MNAHNEQQGYTAADMADQAAAAFERGRASVLAELRAAAQEAVVEYKGRRLSPEGTRECWGVLVKDIEELPHGTMLYTTPVVTAPGIDLATAWAEGYESGVMDERISEANIGIAGFGAKIAPARANPYLIDASLKGGSEARALLDALVSLVAVARRYLPDYDEHPEVQKADDAIDAAMQAQANSHGEETQSRVRCLVKRLAKKQKPKV